LSARSARATLDHRCRHIRALEPNPGSNIVVSLLSGAMTEELRALRWEHVHLDQTTGPAYIEVWRSVRAGGDTKTRASRRTLALPARCVAAPVQHRERQAVERGAAAWTNHGYVFVSRTGTAPDAHNVRREFRAVLRKIDGMDPGDWTPRELRHSFVSLLSDSGIPIEEISRLVGHSTAVTEQVYRHQIRPVVQDGAIAMDRLFGPSDELHGFSALASGRQPKCISALSGTGLVPQSL
jgi:integrase